MVSFMSSSLKTGRFDFYVASGLPVELSAMVWMPGTSRSIRPWWHWWGSWHRTPVSLKPMIWWGQKWWGGVAHMPHYLWPQSQHCCNALPHSWYDTLGLCLGTCNHSGKVGSVTPHGDLSWLQKLNGGDAGRIEQGCLGPLGLLCHSFDGLGDQLLAFLQVYCIGIELGLLTNPTDGPW